MATTALVETAAATPSPNPNRLSVAVWFEIPVQDLARATWFYETIFATKLITDARFPTLAIFPYEKPGISGCLMTNEVNPSTDGTVVYLNADGQLDLVLKRTTANGGKLLEEVAQLPEGMGFTAQIRDLDGNRIGLHAIY